jgi:hypothetical protein
MVVTNGTEIGAMLYNLQGGLMSMSVWMIVAISFVSILLTIFVFVKWFRYLVYGLVVSVPTGIIAWISYGTGKRVEQGDTFWFTTILFILCGVIANIVLGYALRNVKTIKNIEAGLKETAKEEKK